MNAPVSKFAPSRRTLLAVAAGVVGELALGFRLSGGAAFAQTSAQSSFQPNSVVRIDRAGVVTVVVPYAEMGQGALMSVAMLVAEELEIEPSSVRIEHAIGDNVLYASPLLGEQITGGSLSLRGAWKPMRQAGAAARVMLVEAAARNWSVPASACRAEAGQVIHPASGRRTGYGALVEVASTLAVPQDPPLKTGTLRVIGKTLPRIDSPAKVNGSAIFGIDVRLPGMRYASVMACPVFGGTLRRVDHAPALAIRGVHQVVELSNAIAVIADHTGAARKGLTALKPEWSGGVNASLDTAGLVATCDAALETQGLIAETKGEPARAMSAAKNGYEAVFRLPMLAHAAMEPLCCTAHVRPNSCEIWVGSQAPGRARNEVAQALGLPAEAVRVNNHLIGGGFGRRLQSEWITQAALIARQVDAPVKVTWSREEDMRQGSYRFHNHSRVKVGLDERGMPVSWDHRIVGPAVMAWFLPGYFRNGIDLDVTGGAYGPYVLPNLSVDFVRSDPPSGLMVGNWRGVGDTRNGFIVESVIDELAHRAGRDRIEYRRALLAPGSRMLAVLDRAAKESGWGKALPNDSARGVAILSAFGSHIALVAQVDRNEQGRIRVPRMTCVVDCGRAVNPGIVKQQIEGGIIFGLSAALYGKITVSDGQVEQSNFHDYPVVRMSEAPEIDVIIVDSLEEPGGVGEPGTAVVAPAVLNAIRSITSQRILSLPLDPAMVQTA